MIMFDWLLRRKRTQDVDLGVFRALYDSGPHDSAPAYLSLLHLQDPDLAVRTKVLAALQDPDYGPAICHLLAQPDWRGHLIAAIAVSMAVDSRDFIGSLWGAFDRGSWVSPQLAATLLCVDPDFAKAAMSRLFDSGPVLPPKGLFSLERHVATGPASPSHRSAKNAAALMGLLREELLQPDLLSSLDSSADVAELCLMDVDMSGDIAIQWLRELRVGLASLGLGPDRYSA